MDLQNVSNWPLLSALIWLPIVGGALTLMLGNGRPQAARWLALAIALLAFVLSIPLLTGFDFAARYAGLPMNVAFSASRACRISC